MISYIRHNSVFDIGSRTGVSTCVGLYKELDDIYSKYINPQLRVQYDDTDCLCNMSGKQTLDGGSHAFVFHNGSISVTVDEQDNVTVAEAGSGGGGGGLVINATENLGAYTLDKTAAEIDAYLAQNPSVLPVVYVSNFFGNENLAGVLFSASELTYYVMMRSDNDIVQTQFKANDPSSYPVYSPIS